MKKNFPIKAFNTYLDDRLEDATYYPKKRIVGLDDWRGFFKNSDDEIVFGQPLKESEDSYWYYHGPLFGGVIQIFDIEREEFHSLFIEYMNKYYPELKVQKVS